MFATAAAYLAKPLIKWGLIALIIGVLFGMWQWEKHDRIAAEKGEKAARLESDLHAADATRWQAASAERDTAIGQLKDALDQQSDLIEAGRAREQSLRDSLRRTGELNQALQAKSDQLSRDLAQEIADAPGDVRELGPIVSRRAPKLFE